MPYIIKGPVPTEAIGDCPWCGKKKKVLHLIAARIDGELGGDYVCAKCLVGLDSAREASREKHILRNNPEVEITAE